MACPLSIPVVYPAWHGSPGSVSRDHLRGTTCLPGSWVQRESYRMKQIVLICCETLWWAVLGQLQAAIPSGNIHLLHCCLCRGLSASVTLSFCSDLGVCEAISHSLLSVSHFMSILKHVFPQVPPPWLMGSAGPCGG